MKTRENGRIWESRLLVSLVMSGLALPLMAAKTTTFMGQVGVDGGNKFSIAENWRNGVPSAGDTLVVSSVVQSVENDIESLSVKNLHLYKNADLGAAPVLFGNAIAIESGGSLRPLQGSVVSNAVTCAGNMTIGGSESGKLYGALTVSDTLTLGIGGPPSFNNESHVYAYAPIVAGKLTGSYSKGFLHLCSTGNSFGVYDLWYSGLWVNEGNAINSDAVISWRNQQIEATRGRYFFGKGQTIDRIEGPLLSNGLNIYGSGVTVANGTADAITACLLDNSMSFVWNSVGGYTQTFTNRAHSTTGALIVSNGTVCVAAGCSFKKSKTVTVANGATLDITTDVASAFAAVTSLTVDGTLSVGASAGNPFTSASFVANVGLMWRM